MRSLIFTLSLLVGQLLYAQIPSGYYDAANGLTGDNLRAALGTIITNGHVKLSYTPGVWNAYAYTDVIRAGSDSIYDMYSRRCDGTADFYFTLVSDQCTGGSSFEGQCYTREHCLPNSCWGGLDNSANPQYSDLHHLFACDQYVNQYKSNYMIGETDAPTYTSVSNGSKLGPCSFPGYTGVVYETPDCYKGDFARAYLYLATRYKNTMPSWVPSSGTAAMWAAIYNSTTNNWQQWVINLLVYWHNLDPVSQKEIDRNNAIYYQSGQGNRNPYIDHPEYVCMVWTTSYCVSAPVIANVAHSPVNPGPANAVSVTADITDDGSISSATLQWCTDGVSFGNSINMTVNGAPSYITSTSIPAQTAGTTVYYRIVATDNGSTSTTSNVYSYYIPQVEPTNHPTAFSCGTTTTYTIPLSWTDATGTIIPTGYLIKMSSVGFASITDPADGVPEADGATTMNVAAGIQNCTFSGLNPFSTYYFIIYPYTNSGTLINYKLNGTKQSTSCSTTAAGGATITNVLHTPATPTATDAVSVSADVTDPVTISSVILNWCTDGTSFNNSIVMNAGTAPSYTTATSIPAQLEGTVVYYKITATNIASQSTNSVVYSYNVASGCVGGVLTIFTETMGTVAATTTIAAHETANGFDNDAYTMGSLGCTNPGDVRITSFSTGYTGASGSGNIWLTSTNAEYGFSIEGINTSIYTNLLLSFGFRKESGTALPTLALEYSTNGTTWTNIPFAFPVAANASVAWYLISDISIPAAAQTSNLRLRWRKTGTIALRLDDIVFKGTANSYPTAFNVTGGGSCCPGSTGVPVGLSNSQTGVSYQLKRDGNITGAAISGTGAAISFGNQAIAGTYTVLATNSTTGCQTTMTGNVTISYNALPAYYDVTGGGSYCSGSPGVAVGLNSSESGVNYELMIDDIGTGNIIAGTGAAISFGNQTTEGTYSVLGTIIATGCQEVMNGSVAVNITPSLAASVSIAAVPAGSICTGTSVTFTATPTNGGAAPTYQWKKNGSNITGETNAAFTSASLSDGDIITCVMTSNAGTCVTGNPATSNAITMAVGPPLAASVSIAVSPGSTICENTSVTFTATPTNGGTPSYQWKKNGVDISGATNSTYTTSTLTNGETIACVMTTSLTCATGSPATSNTIAMTVNPILPVGVSIAANPGTSVCAGSSVTFTATPVNGGASPAYQWKKNGSVLSGETNATYTTSSLINGDIITCVLTSNTTCPSGNPATSNSLSMTVNPLLPASVSIAAAPAGSICTGTSVTFTATPTNGGAAPTYQWKKNGAIVGSGSTYTDAGLANNDQIVCIMTSNATPCLTGSPSTSNTITMVVGPPLAVSVSIAANPGATICNGTSVTFTATPTNGGATPTYQWKKNGSDIIGETNSTYTTNSLTNSDIISCILTSSLSCASGNPATSNTISMTVNPILPVSVSVAASATTICSGASVTFTATPVNGGSTPAYQWKKNGVNISGETNATYTTSSLANGDDITCVLTSNENCALGNPATSNIITLSVNPLPAPAGTIAGIATVCQSQYNEVYFVGAIANATSYIWTYSGTGATISGSTNSITIDFSASATSGILTVKGVNSCGEGTVSANYNITVNPHPDAAGSISGQSTVCQGQSDVAYSVGAIANTTFYSWTYTGTGATINGTTNNITITFATNATSGILTVKGSNACGYGTVSADFPIIVNSSVTTTFAQLGAYCVGATPDVLPTISTNGISGTWNAAISTAAAGTTIYTFTPNAGQCATATTMSVTVNPVPTGVTASASSNAVCAGESVNLFSSASSGIYTNTTLISPTGNGGFENGNTFALNGWTSVNGANNNWVVGTAAGVQSGTYAAYIGDASTYVGTKNANANHFYRDIVIPAGATNINLSFYYKMPLTDPTTDYLKVYITTPSYTPVAGTTPGTGYNEVFSNSAAVSAYTLQTIPVSSALAGTTLRLVCSYICDNTNPMAVPAIDDFSLTADVPETPTFSWTSTPSGFSSVQQNPAGAIPVATTQYIVTASNSYGCSSTASTTVTVSPLTTPTFAQAGPYCVGATPASLPTTSTNGITGTWSPAAISTASAGSTVYTFTPTAGQCATTATMTVVVNANVTPTFTQAGPYCVGATPASLPTTSTNGITGTWSPAAISTASAGSTVYTFTPTAGQCATTATMTVVVNANVTPTFTQAGPYCVGATPTALPTTSTNGVTGTWSPAAISTASAGSTIYTFTPTAGQCATTATMTVVVNANVTPTFTQAGPYCVGATPASLPATSTNGITGTWSPAAISTASAGTTVYTFTPTAGQCAPVVTMNVTVYPTYTFNESQSICQGQTYTWHGSTYATPGTYTKTYNTIHGCDSIYTLNLTVNPTYAFSENKAICQGSTYTWHGTTYSVPGVYTKNYTTIHGCDSIYTLNLTTIPTYAFSEYHSMCNGESYTWQGTTYTTAGIYNKTFVSSGGCDSTYTLNLVVHPEYSFSENHSVCDGESYLWQGTTYTTAGTYTRAYTTINGCDSIFTLNLTVNPKYSFVNNQAICQGETYTWQGSTYSSAGTYTKSYTTIHGCDSIYTLNLTVYPEYAFSENHAVCQGSSYTWHGTTYSSAGVYTKNYTTIHGCDSVYTLNLTQIPSYAFSENKTICSGESYLWHGNTYTAAGIYSASYISSGGCDSVYTLNLKVNPSYLFTENRSICSGDSYTWHGATYTTTGTYSKTYISSKGCDSTYMLNLTVNPEYSFNESHSICQGESYTWHGTTYSASGTYTKNYLTVKGCDSTYTLTLTVYPAYAFNESHSICNGESYTWHGNTYTTGGTYTAAYTTVNGCDSIYTLNLTVHPTFEFSESHTMCQGESYLWHGSNYTTGGTYTRNYSTINGCDSTYILNLTVHPAYGFFDMAEICQGDSYTWHGSTYTTSGTFTKTYSTIHGCDSIYTLSLTVHPSYAFSENKSICQGSSYTWHGTTYSAAGTYVKNYTTTYGCDSVYTLYLSEVAEYSFTENHSICNGETYTWQGNTYNTAGTYTAVYVSPSGCDSTYTLNLTVNPTYSFNENHSICEGESYTWRGNTYSAAGTYTAAYTTVNGCDSMYTLNLTVNPTYAFNESHSICNGDSYTWHGNTYTAGGTYTAAYTTVNGCDSIYTLSLTVYPTYAFNENFSICQGSTYTWHGTTYSAAGVYTKTYTSIHGCDSVYTLNLSEVADYTFIENHAICNGDSYTWHGNTYNTAGTYTAAYVSSSGCDSTYTLNLTVNPVYSFNESHSICQGQSYTWHGNTYTTAGTYTAVYTTVNGCDSIYTLNLSVNPTYVTLSGVEVCNGETYIWRGNSYTAAGTYYDSLLTQSGCDSVFVLNLTVNPTYAFNENHSICNGGSYTWHGTTYTTGGIYTAAYTTVNGCDSIYTLNLSVNPTYSFNENHAICQGSSYTWHGTTYTTSGTYTKHYTTVNGCDSVYTLNLIVHPTYHFNENQALCQGSVIVWHGNTYSSPGIYTKTYSTIHGCDSIYTLNLTEIESYAFSETHSICAGDSYVWHGTTYTAPGIYAASYVSAGGCDSVYTLDLKVHPTYSFSESHTICDGDSYTWKGNTYTAAGDYTKTYTTIHGCDSTYTLHLSVNPSYTFNEYQSVCQGQSLNWRGNTYSVAGVYTKTYPTVHGCDSTYILNLTVNPTYAFSENHSICQGSTYTWHGTTYSAPGTYTKTYTSIYGCDSIYTLNLTEIASYTFSENHSICSGNSYTWHGTSYSAAGIYTAAYVSSTGCDSVYTLNLTVNPEYSFSEAYAMCEGDSYTWHGTTYTAAGIYTAAYTTVNGCDSIYTLNLSVNPTYLFNESHSICQGSSYLWHGTTYTGPGVYTKYYNTISGCDSIYVLTLSEVAGYAFAENQSICSGDSYTWHGNTYSAGGTYTAAYVSTTGCDSIYTLNLSVNPTYVTLSGVEVCNGETYIWRGNSYTVAGTYYDSLLTQSGCDSVFVLNLTVNPTYAFNEDHSICNGDSYTWHGNTYNVAGTYTAAYVSTTGCDSIYTLNLSVNPTYVTLSGVEVCNGETYIWRGNSYTVAGTYYDSLLTQSGCDSVFVLNLTVNPTYAFNENHSMCNGDSYTWHGNTYSAGGTYTAAYTTVNGCDSIYTLNLTVNPLPLVWLGNDTTICADANIVLDAGNPGATYLWSENAATGQTIIIDSTGHGLSTFDVSVTVNNGCEASDTISITIEPCGMINENGEIAFSVFPNPSDGMIYIIQSGTNADAVVELTDATGKLLYRGLYHNMNGSSQKKEFDLGIYPAGVYFLRIDNEVVRLVRQ